MRLLVVCEGNICRSPMAVGLLSKAAPSIFSFSAGLGALVGAPADEMAVQILRERGIDISSHRAIQITRQMCHQADLVLVMNDAQRASVQAMYPAARGRVYRLGEYTKRDIPDPFKQPEKAFRGALRLIDEAAREWLLRINRL